MKFKKTEVFYEPQLLSWLIKLNIGDKKIPLFESIFGIERGVVINPMKRPRFKWTNVKYLDTK